MIELQFLLMLINGKFIELPFVRSACGFAYTVVVHARFNQTSFFNHSAVSYNTDRTYFDQD